MTKDDTTFPADESKRMLATHLKLGREKAVSYLPIKTVEKAIGVSIPTYIAMIEHSGNHHVIFSSADCCIDSGAVYAFHAGALEEILYNNRSILSENGWPIDSNNFIRKIASHWLDQDDPVMPVIKRAFGDLD